MKINLQPLQQVEISGRGQSVVYLTGDHDLLVMAAGRRAQIASGAQITFPTFEGVTIQNQGTESGDFEILIVEGLYQSLANGATVYSFLQNPETVTDPVVAALAKVLNVDVNNPDTITAPIVTALAQVLKTDVNNPDTITAPIVTALAQVLKTDVNNPDTITAPIVTALAQVLKTDVNNPDTITAPIVAAMGETSGAISTTEKDFTASEVFLIASNEARRDLRIKAASGNAGAVVIAGVPLAAGDTVVFEKYTGEVTTSSETTNKIYITEVI